MFKNLFQGFILSFSLLTITSCSQSQFTHPGLYAVIHTSEGEFAVELWEDKTPQTVKNFVDLAAGKKEWVSPDNSGEKSTEPFYDGLIFHRVISNFMIQGGCPIGDGTGGPGYRFEDECFDGSGEVIAGAINDTSATTVWETVLRPFLNQHQGNTPSKKINDIYKEIMEANSLTPLSKFTVEDLAKETGFTGELKSPGKLISSVDYGTICMANSGPNTNGSQFFVVTKKDGTPWLNGKHTVFGKVVYGMEVVHKIEAVEKGPSDKPKTDVKIKKVKIVRV